VKHETYHAKHHFLRALHVACKAPSFASFSKPRNSGLRCKGFRPASSCKKIKLIMSLSYRQWKSLQRSNGCLQRSAHCQISWGRRALRVSSTTSSMRRLFVAARSSTVLQDRQELESLSVRAVHLDETHI